MKRTNLIVRIAAAVLALLLLTSTLVGGLTAFAADEMTLEAANERILLLLNNSSLGAQTNYNQLEDGKTLYMLFDCEIKAPANVTSPADFEAAIEGAYLNDRSDNWDISSRSEISEVKLDNANDGDATNDVFDVEGEFVVTYIDNDDTDLHLNFSLDFPYDDTPYRCIISLDVEGYFSDTAELPGDSVGGGTSGGDSGGDVDEPPPPIVPEIVVENMIALDSAGNKIDEVTEDTPSFTVEVVFADIGLQHVPVRYLRDRDLEAYVTTPGGFILGSSARGTIEMVTQADYPRFRARFTDVTYTGGDKTLGFTVFYDLHGLDDIETHKGTGTGTLYAAEAEGEDEEDSTAGIKIPKIIISAYTYGEEAIVAGDEFPLDFTVTNTSTELPLENIVMTLTPAAPAGAEKGPGLIVASSSNTIYLPALGPGASMENSVSFKARPDAEVTSHLIDVKFSYEYQKSEKEGYVAAPELSESIAIPVSQIDRFSVDPIQEEPYGQVGEETYLTVNFINKGKSPTYNVSGTVKIDESVTAPPQHFGNLEAGASDSLDFYLTGSMPGVFAGEVVMQYEDDNGAVKEISSPFSMTVEEPYIPEFDRPMDPGMMEPPPPAGPNIWTVILCSVGGLAIAVPLALYLMKRVRAKGREDFDESV